VAWLGDVSAVILIGIRTWRLVFPIAPKPSVSDVGHD